MPKAPKNSVPANVDPKGLKKQSKDLIHAPTRIQEKMKAKFWTRFSPGPMMSPDDVSLADVCQIIGNRSMEKYWSDLTFREWFLNMSEEREQVKYLFGKGLAALEQILEDPLANPGATVNALKLVAELKGDLSKKVTEKFVDEDINKMDEHQLETYLKKQGYDVAHVVTPLESKTIVDVEED